MTVALLASSMLVGLAAVPLASADDLQHKKTRVEKHINSAKSELDESSARLRRATEALQQAEAKLSVARDKLAGARGQVAAAASLDQQMQAKLLEAESLLDAARGQLATGQAEVAEQQETLGEIVVSNYQTGDPGLMGLSMLLSSQDPAELSGQLNSVQSVLDKETVTLDRLEASKILLVVKEEQVEAAKVEVAAQRKAAAENLAEKRVLEVAAEKAREAVDGLVTVREAAHGKSMKARRSDLAELRKLEREQAKISAMLKQRAAEARARARRERASRGASSSARSAGGFLAHPVAGYITSPFGWRTHPLYGYRSLHDGIDFGAACGTPIYASASGRVLQEYFQTAFGNRLILDHGFQRGAGVATIYNHLDRYAVSSGAYVQRGQLIGYVGSTGWSTGCHLHFTVMRNGVAVDPMPWL